MIQIFLCLLLVRLGQPQGSDAMSKMSYQAQQKAAEAQAIAQAAAMGVPITIKPNTPPPPPEMESIGTEPSPSSYDDLFTYSGYFDPYQDDVHAFMINGKRRKRHRVNCGRDRKGRHCDFRRSHHQHSFYNKDCIHYAGDLEIYGVWQCGSRQHLSKGAIIRLMVELHELIIKYKQDKNDYILERLERLMEYNRNVHKEMKKIFDESARSSLQRIVDVLEKTNEQVFQNFLNIKQMSNDILKNIVQDREDEIEELQQQLAEMVNQYPPPMTICDTINDCSLCMSRNGCIWCLQEQKCRQGSLQLGASFYACDIWARNADQCEEEVDYEIDKKVNSISEMGDYYNQPDLELSQKLFIAQKQREMVQVKNQLDNRVKILSQIKQSFQSIRNRQVKYLEQYAKRKDPDGSFLDFIDGEDAQDAFNEMKQVAEEMMRAEEEEMQMTKEEKKRAVSLKKEEELQFEKQQMRERHKAIPIDKKKYKTKKSVNEILHELEHPPEEENDNDDKF